MIGPVIDSLTRGVAERESCSADPSKDPLQCGECRVIAGISKSQGQLHVTYRSEVACRSLWC